MIDAERFNLIKRMHGAYGSWAVWVPACGAPKSNMGDVGILNEDVNHQLFKTLKPGIVMIGLNISRSFPNEPFRNFHDPDRSANDFKIRYAFSDTACWGAYMTDVIKWYKEPVSGKLLEYLKMHPQVVVENIKLLRAELLDLGHPQPVILAFGRDAYSLLKQNLCHSDYSQLVMLTHYSYRISKEKYRITVHSQIAKSLPHLAMKHSSCQ